MARILVVDSNILFSFFWEKSFTRDIIQQKKLVCISPEFALEEIERYQDEISTKTLIAEKEFYQQLEELKDLVRFIPCQDYSEFIKEATKISPDINDSDFFALALKASSPIWSNDSDLKKQDRITILNTGEIMDLLDQI